MLESESWRLLQTLAPHEWIVRELTERDYGIDCYIELVSAEDILPSIDVGEARVYKREV